MLIARKFFGNKSRFILEHLEGDTWQDQIFEIIMMTFDSQDKLREYLESKGYPEAMLIARKFFGKKDNIHRFQVDTLFDLFQPKGIPLGSSMNAALKSVLPGFYYGIDYQNGEDLFAEFEQQSFSPKDSSKSHTKSSQGKHMNDGDERVHVCGVVGGVGRGKTRGLHELGFYHNRRATEDCPCLSLFVTYNTHCSGFPNLTDQCLSSEWQADLAARIAFGFYIQVCCPVPDPGQEHEQQHPKGTLGWTQFCSQFHLTSWVVLDVLDVIDKYYERFNLPPPKILLLIDELMKVPEYDIRNKPTTQLVHSPGLISVLDKLAYARHKRCGRMDFVVSSLEPDAFSGYESDSGRKMSFLPLPVISTEHVATLFMTIVEKQLDGPVSQDARTMCQMLAQFAGPIPRHFVNIYKVLSDDFLRFKKFFTTSPSSSTCPEEKTTTQGTLQDNRTRMIQCLLEQFTWSTSVSIKPPGGQHFEDNKQKIILLRVLQWCASYSEEPKAKQLKDVLVELKVPLSALLSAALVLPVAQQLIRPSVIGLLCAVRYHFGSSHTLGKLMEQMITLWIEDKSGISAEQFHVAWHAFKQTIHYELHVLEPSKYPSRISLPSFYHLPPDFWSLFCSHSPSSHNVMAKELLCLEEAQSLFVDVSSPPGESVSANLEAVVGAARFPGHGIFKFESGTDAVDWGFNLKHGKDDSTMLCFGQQKTSKGDSTTKWSRSDLLTTHNNLRTKVIKGDSTTASKFVFIWAAFRDYAAARSKKVDENVCNVLVLSKDHLLALYGPFCVVTSTLNDNTLSHTEKSVNIHDPR